jgi:hypothetical protein
MRICRRIEMLHRSKRELSLMVSFRTVGVSVLFVFCAPFGASSAPLLIFQAGRVALFAKALFVP